MATAPSQDTIKAVVAAVQVFSGQPDKASLAAANTWLQDFQHTPDAWGTCNYLLLSPDAPSETKTFAAQTFRAKVTFDLEQVDPSQRIGLRDSLLTAFKTYAAGPRVVLIQLCLALSGLALQMSEWKDAVSGLIESFGQDPAMVPALLELLTVLPEEISGNTRIPMSNEAYAMREAELLTANSAEVIKLLAMYMQAPGITQAIQAQIFKCLRSWVVSGEVAVKELARTPLFDFAFQALSSDQLFDVAVDVVCDIIHETQEVEDNMAVIELIVQRLVPLKSMLASSKEDPDRIRGYCRIFTEAGETYRLLLLHHPETFFPIVEAIAECSAYPDLDIVPITFNFWYRLAQVIGKRSSVPTQFLDLYKGLVNVMIGHLHFPLDPEAMTAQERDEFRAFRHVMGDTLKDCCYVLGSSSCLHRAYEMITSALSVSVATGQPPSWQEIEAPLFSMRSMGAEVDSTSDTVLPLIMDLIPNLPNHPRVRYAATLVISRYTEWIDKHPNYIQFQLSYISAGFEDPDIEVSAASGQAMKYLCKDCKQHLVPYLPLLHTFIQTAGPKLPQDDRLQVYEAIGHVISFMPMEDAGRALRQFSLEILTKVHELVSLPEATNDHLQQISDYLEQLDSLVRVVQGFGEELPTACRNTCAELWSVLDTALQRYGGHYAVSERICQTLRLGLQFFGTAALPVAPSLLDRLSTAFEGSGFSCYVWIIAKSIGRFGDEENLELRQAISRAFERTSAHVFAMLKALQVTDIPDVIEDYIHLLLEMVASAPDLLLPSPSFPDAFRVALSSLSLLHPDHAFTALEFILAVIGHDSITGDTPTGVPKSQDPIPNFPVYASAIRRVVDEQGFQLLGLLLTGFISHFPVDATPIVITLFRLLAKFWPQQTVVWLPGVLEQIPKTVIPLAAQSQFATDYSTAAADGQPDRVKPAVLALQRASRRARERSWFASSLEA